jgi:hypothetical protein
MCLEKDLVSARSRWGAVLKKHPALKPASHITTATLNSEWTFTHTNTNGQPAILLSLDAMEYVLHALAGKVQTRKSKLEAYIQACKLSYPAKKRCAAGISSGAVSKIQTSNFSVHAIARVVGAQMKVQCAGLESSMGTVFGNQMEAALLKHMGMFQPQAGTELFETKVQLACLNGTAEQLRASNVDRDNLIRENSKLIVEVEHLRAATAKESCFSQQNAELKAELKQLQEKDAKESGLVQENAELKAEVKQLRGKDAGDRDSVQKNAELTARVETLREELVFERREKNCKVEKLEKANDENKELVKDNNSLKRSLDDSQKKVDELTKTVKKQKDDLKTYAAPAAVIAKLKKEAAESINSYT